MKSRERREKHIYVSGGCFQQRKSQVQGTRYTGEDLREGGEAGHRERSGRAQGQVRNVLASRIGRRMESLKRNQHLLFKLHLNLGDSTLQVIVAASDFGSSQLLPLDFPLGQSMDLFLSYSHATQV